MKIEPLSLTLDEKIKDIIEMQEFLRKKCWEVTVMELRIPEKYHGEL